MNYRGVIIEESLKDKEILNEVRILSTNVEQTTEKHQTPHLKQWVLHMVEVDENKADEVAKRLSQVLKSEPNSWYADYKNEESHYIIFPGRIFKVDRKNKEQYEEATKHGLSLGIPDYQVDFIPFVNQWKR